MGSDLTATTSLTRTSPSAWRGVNQRAGSSFTFQIASISLANAVMPLTLAAKSIQRCGSIEHQIDEMLT
ncbi:hypothetical protein [Halolamina rubra]|uniref:hypothetical protein n=1 Tax=Halolamina rubra TaxID=1380430 RepID=UPI0006785DF1|nr:hypothetical protein [Halolamina rubra]